jgi:ribonuclease J
MADATAVSMNENGDLGFKRRYHASGHASCEDITWAIEQIDPDYIVPIHTEARDWFSQNFENVFLPTEGQCINFK